MTRRLGLGTGSENHLLAGANSKNRGFFATEHWKTFALDARVVCNKKVSYRKQIKR